MSFILSSPAFRYGEPIPETFTHDGSNVSPPLHWTDPPSGTKSLALIVDDPDAPGGTFVHWVLANLPPDRRDLPEKVATSERLDEPAGAVNGRNSFGKTGYGGPKPPPGPPHRYYFKLYALDTSFPVRSGATKEYVEFAMKDHILASGELMGTYRHR